MCSGQDHEAPVLVVDVFHGGPGANDAVSRTEREVVKVLVSIISL